MKALFIGRFQPFHLGHLHAIKQILQECDAIVIGIGSAQYNNTKENPLPFDLRKEIITEVLQAEEIENFTVVGIDDVNNDAQWVKHVLSITGSVDVVYTGNEKVKKLFSEAGILVNKDSTIVESSFIFATTGIPIASSISSRLIS